MLVDRPGKRELLIGTEAALIFCLRYRGVPHTGSADILG
jgi:hypothetical protein